MGKRDRRQRKRERRTDAVSVRCDECGRVQRNKHGYGPVPAGCTNCTHIYGTYAAAA